MRSKFVCLFICLLFSSLVTAGLAKADGLKYSVSATIQATARVVPSVGVEAANDTDPETQFWLYAPRPGGVYVVLQGDDGMELGFPDESDLTILEQHRYRALVEVRGSESNPDQGPITLTVIYSGN
jgi:hypothetical protein